MDPRFRGGRREFIKLMPFTELLPEHYSYNKVMTMTSKMSQYFKIVCSILTLCALILLAFAAHQHATEIIAWSNELGWMAPVLFLVTYCFATILLLPTMVLTLAGGAIFGPVFGTIFNLLGATLGAACAFLITRHLIYDWFNQKKGEKLNRLIVGVEKRGWLFIALLRLFPIVPFNLVNYGLGVTGIKFRLYVILTFIFLIPAEIVYTYCGYVGMDILTHSGALYKYVCMIIFGMMIIGLCIMNQVKKLR